MSRELEQTFGELPPTESAMMSVITERERQDNKWGEQNHDPFIWLGILQEEVGEFSKEVNDNYFDNKENLGRMREEAVQIAAVALAMVECIDRQKWGYRGTVKNG